MHRRKKTIFITIQKKISFVTVDKLLMETWFFVRICIAKGNGSIWTASKRAIFLRNGTATNARRWKIKQRTPSANLTFQLAHDWLFLASIYFTFSLKNRSTESIYWKKLEWARRNKNKKRWFYHPLMKIKIILHFPNSINKSNFKWSH